VIQPFEINMLKVLLLLSLTPVINGWSWDQIDDDVQTKICTYVVGKIEGDLEGAACDWIVAEVTGYAAGLLAATGAAEIIEDPIIAGVADHICDKALSAVASHYHVGPNGICSDIGVPWSFRRRREFANATDMPDWTAATTARWHAIRASKMQTLGTPVAVFPDQSVGYCYPDPATGAYTCMDSGYATSIANSTNAGQVVYKMSQSSSMKEATSSSPQGTQSDVAAIGVACAFAVGLVACAVYIVVLKKQLATLAVAHPERLLAKDDEYASAN